MPQNRVIRPSERAGRATTLRGLAWVLVLMAPLLATQVSAQEPPPGAPLSVSDAIAAALKGQPRLKAAESQLEAAQARSRDERLNQVGELATTLLYTPTQKPLRIDFPGLPPNIPPISFDVKQVQTYAAMATYTLPVWTFGALAGQREAARSGERATQCALARARQQTALEAERAFYQAAAAVAGVEVAVQSQEQQRAFLDVAQKRADAGAAARLDVLKAELAVARAEADLVEARNREALARELLVTATNDERFRPAALTPLAPEADVLPDETQAVATAAQQRPDLASRQGQVDAARFAGNALQGARLPALALRAQITQQNAALRDVLRKDSQIYQVGLALNWDVTRALRGASVVAEQRASERGLVHTLHAEGAAVALEVRSALSSAREARERIRIQTHAVAVAEEQARVARLAYAEGVITSVEAQDAERGLTAARVAELAARLDGATARAELRFAMGQ
jgi:outer membrane protein